MANGFSAVNESFRRSECMTNRASYAKSFHKQTNLAGLLEGDDGQVLHKFQDASVKDF